LTFHNYASTADTVAGPSVCLFGRAIWTIAYRANHRRRTKERRLWRVSPYGNDEMEVAEAEVYQPAFSPNGKLAAYFSREKAGDPYKVAIISIDNGKVLKSVSLGEQKAEPVCIAWLADNQSLDYIVLSNSNSLWRQSLDDDRPQLIADLGNEE